MKYENIVRCQFSSKKECEMHFHQDIEVIYVLDGSLEVGFEGRKFDSSGKVYSGPEPECDHNQ